MAAPSSSRGGTVGNDFDAEDGSEVTITGGTFGDGFDVRSMVDISGGTFGEDSRTICNHWNLVQTNFESQEKALR